MPSWKQLLDELNNIEGTLQQIPLQWIDATLNQSLKKISELRENRNVIFYASCFLQKPDVPQYSSSITGEELNGLMSVMHGMDWGRGLTLILHTPGGIINATETIVEYLYQKFEDIEVIIPALAMSAGTMISLASNRIIMGRQSQLGPIDPQMPIQGFYYSAQSVTEQFDRAKSEILNNRDVAHVWAPILQTIGPALLQEAENALSYGEDLVGEWLQKRMLRGQENATEKAQEIAKFFRDASIHKSHGRRIDREKAREKGVAIIDLEDDGELQDAVLTAYHVMTIIFEKSPTAKLMVNDSNGKWVKNWGPPSAQ